MANAAATSVIPRTPRLRPALQRRRRTARLDNLRSQAGKPAPRAYACQPRPKLAALPGCGLRLARLATSWGQTRAEQISARPARKKVDIIRGINWSPPLAITSCAIQLRDCSFNVRNKMGRLPRRRGCCCHSTHIFGPRNSGFRSRLRSARLGLPTNTSLHRNSMPIGGKLIRT
jgi:hypothetical protein